MTSAASSGGICSMMSAACSLSISEMRSAWTSGSSSCRASAAVSVSSFSKKSCRSSGARSLMIWRDPRVEVRDRIAGDRQRQAVESGFQRLQVLPGDQLVAQGVADRLEEGASAALDAQPPQDPRIPTSTSVTYAAPPSS